MTYVPVILVILLVCASIFVNGWTDSPNAIATVVATRVLKPKVAIALGACFNFLGVLTMGSAVAATTATIVDLGSGQEGLITLAAAQLSIVLWAVAAWKFGIPTSESHALIAGLMGAGMSLSGVSAFNWQSVKAVLWGLFISTIIGFIAGYGVTWIIRKVCEWMQPNRRKANHFFSVGQVASASLMAFSHGAQDGQKFMGVLYLALVLGKMLPAPSGNDWDIPVWIMILCSVLMAFGTSIGGYRIIKTVGMEMVQLEKYQGFGAELAASGSMIVATVLGIPLSTTNTKGTAMMGAGATAGIKKVNWGVAREMVTAWVLTFPACLLLGYIFATVFRFFLG
ncbi:MAG: inorganic phosphate transporter [Oscillospiraceae bacterium]|mgnify:CR=1 FL=1|nr:inorganic phosphate transporter [Oscillospiraceae bacterium]